MEPASINLSAPSSDQIHGHDDEARRALSDHADDLPELVDLALRTNPQTRRDSYAAQAAEAQLGQSRADNYPKVATDADSGYLKLPIQFPGQTLIVRNEAFLPQIRVSYDLLDFGRSRAAERSAREQLIAANFVFNRITQDVVFNVEKSYYILSAATASVAAAEANLKVARTSLGSIEERHQMGLATKRQILLAKQVEAQAVYDLENAKSMVHDAGSNLCEAVGVTSNETINVQGIERQSIPPNLSDDVETLINDAAKETRYRRTDCCGPRGRRCYRQGRIEVLPRSWCKWKLWANNLELYGKWRSHAEPGPTILWGAAYAAMESFHRI